MLKVCIGLGNVSTSVNFGNFLVVPKLQHNAAAPKSGFCNLLIYGDLVGAWRFELQTSCAQDRRATSCKSLSYSPHAEKPRFAGRLRLCLVVWGCARLLEGSLQKSLQSLSPADSITGAKKILLLLPLIFFCAATRASAAYSFKRVITIDHTMFGGTDSTNFPLAVFGTYVDLKTVGNGGSVQNSSGFGIVFTSDAGCTTLMTFENETYSATTGAIASG